MDEILCDFRITGCAEEHTLRKSPGHMVQHPLGVAGTRALELSLGHQTPLGRLLLEEPPVLQASVSLPEQWW